MYVAERSSGNRQPVELLVQLPAGGVLEDQKHPVRVVEVAKQAEDVGVPQVRLDLNLPPQLVLHVALAQLRLVQHLERHDVAAGLFARQVDVAKLALAQRPANVKVVEPPRPVRRRRRR